MPRSQHIVVEIGGSPGVVHEVTRQTRAQEARLIIVGRDRAKLAVAAERLGKASTTLFELNAYEEAALETLFSRLEAIGHLVSMVGDSMTGGFLTTWSETMH